MITLQKQKFSLIIFLTGFWYSQIQLATNPPVILAIPVRHFSFESNVQVKKFPLENEGEIVGHCFTPHACLSPPNLLGTGSYGHVFHIQLPSTYGNSSEYALKTIGSLNSMHEVIFAFGEALFLSWLNHEHILRAKSGYIVFAQNLPHINIVLPIVPKDLHSITKQKKLTPILIKKLMYQLLLAVHYTHSAGVIHRDIKPTNILVEDDNLSNIRLSDFGLATLVDSLDNKRNHSVMSEFYRAPEVIKKREYGTKSDMWSIGALFGELAFGRPLFSDRSIPIDHRIAEFINRFSNLHDGFFSTRSPPWNPIIFKDGVRCPMSIRCTRFLDKLGEKGMDLLAHLLEPNPDHRYSAKEALLHEYFHELGPINLEAHTYSGPPLQSRYPLSEMMFTYPQDAEFDITQIKTWASAITKEFNWDKFKGPDPEPKTQKPATKRPRDPDTEDSDIEDPAKRQTRVNYEVPTE